MALGCVELVLLLGVLAGVLILIGRYPGLARILFRPLPNRRISGWQLLIGAFFLSFLAFTVSDPASKPGHPLSAAMYPLFVSSAIVLFLWAMLRFLGLPVADASPANRPPPTPPKLRPAERSLFQELSRLIASMTARVSRLSFKDVLLGSMVVIGIFFLVVVPVNPPHEHEAFAVLFFFFFWVISSLAFWFAVWLLRRV